MVVPHPSPVSWGADSSLLRNTEQRKGFAKRAKRPSLQELDYLLSTNNSQYHKHIIIVGVGAMIRC